MRSVSHLTIHASSIYMLVENCFGVSIVLLSLTSNHIKGVKCIEIDKIPQRTDLSLVWNKMNRNPLLNQGLDLVSKLPVRK